MQAVCQVEWLFPAMAIAGEANPVLALAIMVTFRDSLGLGALATGAIMSAIAAEIARVGRTRTLDPSPLSEVPMNSPRSTS